MLANSKLRIGSKISYKGETATITSLTRTSIAFRIPSNPHEEAMRKMGALDIHPIGVTPALLKDKLLFVEYDSKEGGLGAIHLTDGRIIISFLPEQIFIMLPNPYAAHSGMSLNTVTSIKDLHELQNIYLDIFDEELDTGKV